MVALIVTKASNGVIGNNDGQPLYLRADLKHFKELTTGHTIIMGRRTFDSLYDRLQRPLPNRRNIIVTASLATVPQGFELARSPEEALVLAGGQGLVFIIGGATTYQAYLDKHVVDTIYLTEVHADLPGNIYFPDLSHSEWRELVREDHGRDSKNPYDYSFVTLQHIA